MKKFYLYFSACFGTFWTLVLIKALIEKKKNLIGIDPIIIAFIVSLLYGLYKARKK